MYFGLILTQSEKEPFKLYNLENQYTIAFYNLENFFDTKDDPHNLDDDCMPEGFRKRNESKLRNKSRKIVRTLSEIGREGIRETPSGPLLGKHFFWEGTAINFPFMWFWKRLTINEGKITHIKKANFHNSFKKSVGHFIE